VTRRRPTTRELLLSLLLTAIALAVSRQPLAPAPQPLAQDVSSPKPAPDATTLLAAGLAAPERAVWEAAVASVEERRSRAGRVEIPSELMHYEDRRRFLAVQMAATREDNLEMPHDEAELVDMIQRGELVELAPLTDDTLLYEVGSAVDIDPLTHFDVASGKDVPLFASLEDVEREEARLEFEGAGRGTAAARARERSKLLASFYGDPVAREPLFRDHAAVTRFAQDFGGLSYDLAEPGERARFQARLMSFLRPQARDVLLPVARAYRERFGRRLPVSSLVRTARYQRRLIRLNPNASRAEMPPHTTGEAFDVTYRFMAPDEQNFLMEEIAQRKRDGQVEALRENRNAFHVYVFVNGRRPPEELVDQYVDVVGEPYPRLRASQRLPGRGRASRAF